MTGEREVKAVRVRVSGTVQGVGFRYFTRSVAAALGIDGYVRNLSDGSVEAVAEGESDRVDMFVEKVSKGPPASRVSGVRVSEIAPSGREGFEIRL